LIIYRIKDWNEHFEVAQGRICAKMTWVAFPNRHDGKGFRRIARHPRSIELFTAWVLIVQVASKQKTRGLLADEAGALTPEDLADSTLYPEEIFKLAFDVLSQTKIGWLEKVKDDKL